MGRDRRPPLLVTLTAAAGSADAVCYLGLGHVFPANMTGNTVLLAIGLTNHDPSGAARSALALLGFVVGAGLAGLAGAEAAAPEAVTRRAGLLAAESLVLVTATAWWLTVNGPPTGATRDGLVVLFGFAMGVQSGVVTSLHLGVSTTYITGTWTAASRVIADRLRRRLAAVADKPRHDTVRLQCAVLVCYFAAALFTGLLFASFAAPAAVTAAGLASTATAATVAAGGGGLR